ncbi:sugar transferase [Ferrimonas senticii]|uniref:sugar transferase n=1 Tax=Ferrimonas senticii TaxID=394566 RepID=UPI0004266DFB|nr:sugar transferase [Ferrimonas senticii]
MMLLILLLLVLTAALSAHLLLYPWWMARRAKRPRPQGHSDGSQSSVMIVVPCYNEPQLLSCKLDNLLGLEDAAKRLTVRVVIDGGSADCLEVGRGFRQRYRQAGIRLQLFYHRRNRGKCFRLNQHLRRVPSSCHWLLLSDCSALLSANAIQELDNAFYQPDVGAVTGRYQHQGDPRLERHWRQLHQLRQGEDLAGAVMGGAGAAIALRPQLFRGLPDDCINDDFELMMMVLRQGWQSRYLPGLLATDVAAAASEQLFSQRRRIAAGNVQQLPSLWQAMRQQTAATRLLAALGKGTRALLPLLLVLWALTATVLLLNSIGLAAIPILLVGGLLLVAPHLGWQVTGAQWSLALQGALIGCLYGVVGRAVPWHRVTPCTVSPQTLANGYQPSPVRLSKRLLDLVAAAVGLLLLLPLLPLIALAIKLDSNGPIFYRQLRIGARHQSHTELIYITKFRTMRIDAEASGARWASSDDPRVTRVGRVLRATRLDELPQLWQVLQGQLSLVGPRPERPQFCGELEQQLPFYLERTFGLRPGLTGLAQIHQAGDTCLADVQNKLQYDHAYAASLAGLKSYWRMELAILWRTVWVVAAAKGH